MSNATIEISKKQVLEALVQLSPKDLKYVVGRALRKKSFAPPALKKLTTKGRGIVKQEGLKPEVVRDAVKWARSVK